MSDATKLDPRSLTSEERAWCDAIAVALCSSGNYSAAGAISEAVTLGLPERRALFGEPASEGGKVECPNCREQVGPGWDHEACNEQFTCKPAQPESEKVECPNCHHEDTGHAWKVNGELRYSCKGWNKPAQPEPESDTRTMGGGLNTQPEPVAAYHAAPMMGFPCANCGQETLRMDGHVSFRASGFETEYYCDKPEPVAHEDAEFLRAGAAAMARIIERDEQPEPVVADTFATDRAIGAQVADASALEPVAAEMPEAVESLLGILATRIDALDHSWRPWYQPVKEAMARVRQAHAAQPAPAVAMTDELEILIAVCEQKAIDQCHEGMPEAAHNLRRTIDSVRSQAAEAGKVPDCVIHAVRLRRSYLCDLPNSDYGKEQALEMRTIEDWLRAAEGKVAG